MDASSVTETAGKLVRGCRRDGLLFSQVFILSVSLLMLVIASRLYISLMNTSSGSVDDMGTGLFFIFVVIPMLVYSVVGVLFSFVLIPFLRSRYDLPVEWEGDVSDRKKRSRIAKVVTFVFVVPLLFVLLLIMDGMLPKVRQGGTQEELLALGISTGLLLLIAVIIVKM